MKYLILTILAPALLLAIACGGGGDGSKADVVEQTWDCMADLAEKSGEPQLFEESMMMMFPTAKNLDDAKKQYIYVSQAAPLDDLKAARDEACGDMG